MKLNFRDLKQQKFTIDAEPSDTVQQIKEKIEAEKGWEASTQKLIYSGKILQDANTVESYKIEEKGFIVCMVSKPKAAPKPAAAPATPKATTSTPAQPAAPAPSTSNTAPTEPPATPSPAQPATGAVPGAGFGDNSAMLVGNRSREAIQEMVAMGFDEADATAALRAAFFNPDRAIDYLLNGIPDNVRAEQAAQQAQRQGGAAGTGPAATVNPTTPAAAAPTAPTVPAVQAQEATPQEEVNLFDMAAQTAGRGGATAGSQRAGANTGAGPRSAGLGAGTGATPGAAGGPEGMVDMEFLRNSPHFQHLRQIVQQQPAMLEPILQQVAEGNPQLAQMIAANQGQFLQLLSEDMGEGGGALPPGAIAVTEEENAAIERLIGLGFARDRVIQAYFACDKNEELAANFLFEQPEDDD